jgi:signal transduction histidine kinase
VLRGVLARLRVRLLLAHLAVIAVGFGVLALAASLATPRLFERHVAEMMQTPAGMGPGRMGESQRDGMAAGMDAQIAGAYRRALFEALVLGGVAALGTAVAASLLLTHQVAGPIARVAGAGRRIACGEYAERVPEAGAEEIRQLAASFNTMASALEDTERLRLELIGDVAHELRTPIATLEGYLEGLLDGVVEPSDRTWAKLHTEAGRLRRLVDDLRELSRAEAGQLAVAPRSVDPGGLARAAAERLAGDFAAKGLELRVDVAPALPAVRADPDRVSQVLTNLLTNALRYTPSPGRVELAVVPAAGAIRFRVADTGIGILSEHLPHVFERFYRADKSRSRAFGGSGVGLTIARALVEAMGGRIWAESAGSGRGATFSFELPVDRSGSERPNQLVRSATGS